MPKTSMNDIIAVQKEFAAIRLEIKETIAKSKEIKERLSNTRNILEICFCTEELNVRMAELCQRRIQYRKYQAAITSGRKSVF